ncbi:MAG: hypothetical protein LQ347_005630 [Umbilicaria vellea]|nr:MAG: hypothetical protein LQ347_005630 [Umbilicaria vellea]
MRLSRSPPIPRSYPLRTTTCSLSPVPLTEEQQRIAERRASLPYEQFHAQESEERERLWAADPETSWERPIPAGGLFGKMVYEQVRKNWVNQGIWNDNWDDMAFGQWKHEEPLELESESETDSEADFPPPAFFFSKPGKQAQLKPRRPKSDKEMNRIAERRVLREREREASRPYHQFVFQVSKERARSENASKSADHSSVADINTRAYEHIKNTWIKRGIWDRKWGILPGMSWKHEEPLEQTLDDSLISETHAGNATLPWNEAGTAPPRSIFGCPSSIISHFPEEFGIINASKQGSSACIDSSSLSNDDANNTRTSPNVPDASHDEQSPRRGTSLDTIRPHHQTPEGDLAVAGEAFTPFHPANVYKAAGEKQPEPQHQPHIPKKVFAYVQLFSPVVDAAERQPSPVAVTPRRSERLQRGIHDEPKESTSTASPISSKRTLQRKPKRDVSTNTTARRSAKPQGILKKETGQDYTGKR